MGEINRQKTPRFFTEKWTAYFFPWKQLNNYFELFQVNAALVISFQLLKFKCYWRWYTQCTTLPEHFWGKAQWHKHIHTHLMALLWIPLPAQLFISVRLDSVNVYRVTGRSLYSPYQPNLKETHQICRPLSIFLCLTLPLMLWW